MPQVAAPQNPAGMVDLLLQMTAPDQQEAKLLQALQRVQAGVKSLEEQRLGYEENGWHTAWQIQFDNKTALVAAITRVLAERFGR
ncbi:hypothetical protein [Hymenobacter mellowenesis]|nr:hypothetical protein [Hymenobacter sp. M29]